MKQKLFNLLLSTIIVTTALTSCDDDTTPAWKEGAKVELPAYRAFILSEGSYGYNNSHLVFVNPETYEPYHTDIFEAQNGIKLGDTANDMIAYNGDIYVVMNGSEVLYRLNGSGVLQAQYSGFEADGIGSPRYVAAHNGKLYVTCYGGYIARFDAKTLKLEGKVGVDNNPEEIEIIGTKAYCVCSGWGFGKTVCSADIIAFQESESVETLPNPVGLKQADGNVYVLNAGTYNSDYSYATYPCVASYNPIDHTTTYIADASRVCAVGECLYIAECNHSPHTFSIYNARTKELSAWSMTDMPEGFSTETVYMIEHNPYDGSFLIATTDYVSNSVVYHIDANGKFIGSFSAGGINASSMVFVK